MHLRTAYFHYLRRRAALFPKVWLDGCCLPGADSVSRKAQASAANLKMAALALKSRLSTGNYFFGIGPNSAAPGG